MTGMLRLLQCQFVSIMALWDSASGMLGAEESDGCKRHQEHLFESGEPIHQAEGQGALLINAAPARSLRWRS